MDYGHCLLDKPTDEQPLPTYLPGEVYNVSRQCELVFGEGSTVCPYGYMVGTLCPTRGKNPTVMSECVSVIDAAFLVKF